MASTPTRIELRHLRYFLAVADELHFRRAAERLHMAQPPLSQAIRAIEHELGVQLFDRTSRSVSLTEAGRVFAADARSLLAGVDFAIGEARRAAVDQAVIQIGCVPDAPIAHLHRFLAGLREILPDAQPRLRNLASLDQASELRAGHLDLGILHDPGLRPDIDTTPVFAGEPMTALVPATHRLAELPAISPDDLADEPLVMFPRTANAALHDRVLAIIAGIGYRPRAVLEAPGADRRDLELAVAEGRGIALVPATREASGEEVVTQRPLDRLVPMPDSVLAWRGDPPRLLRQALGPIRELARELHRTTTLKRDPATRPRS
jgi:DNA-binding transcriptional LysR family regulator